MSDRAWEPLIPRRAPDRLVLPCACGGVVDADPLSPEVGVRRHNETRAHKRWRRRRERDLSPEVIPGPTA